MICICLWIWALATTVHADVFKQDEAQLTSVFTRPFDFGSETVKRKASRQADLDKSIAHQMRTMLSTYDINALMNAISRSPLMLWQYSSPAAADLFKHYHTTAYLKLGMLYDDLRGMEAETGGSLDILRDEAELACIREKLANRTFEGDIVDIMLSCRSNGTVLGQGTVNIFEKIFNRFKVGSEQKEMMLEILPKWEIDPNGYRLQGPLRRIGAVLSDNRQRLKEQLEGMLKTYAAEKAVSGEDLKAFSLPGLPFTEQMMRDLLMLDTGKRQERGDGLIERLAAVKTLYQYDLTLEWLKRALNHPSIERAYKNIIGEWKIFLQQEKGSLLSQQGQIGSYASAVKSMLDESEKERLDIISHQQ